MMEPILKSTLMSILKLISTTPEQRKVSLENLSTSTGEVGIALRKLEIPWICQNDKDGKIEFMANNYLICYIIDTFRDRGFSILVDDELVQPEDYEDKQVSFEKIPRNIVDDTFLKLAGLGIHQAKHDSKEESIEFTASISVIAGIIYIFRDSVFSILVDGETVKEEHLS